MSSEQPADAEMQASSFGAAAESYERGRPEYPQPTIEWLIPSGARPVLDLGAGTGKLTRALVRSGVTVTAVEPSARMRVVLAGAVPEAKVLEGTAERIPLADGSVDAVAVAQAWHWFDAERARAEIARALTPGGVLALVWNIRDETDPWLARLGEIMHQHAEQPIDTSPEIGRPFANAERTDIHWRRTVDRDTVLDMVASRSYVIALPAAQRQRLLADVADHFASHPEVSREAEITLPYVAHCTRARRA
jgi:SAM-dependent methyltransferase